MKKILLLLSCLALGGCTMITNKTEETRKVNEYVLTEEKFKELQDKIALYIVNKFENVKSIKFKKLTIQPMGYLGMGAIINDNNEVSISMSHVENAKIYVDYNIYDTNLVEYQNNPNKSLDGVKIEYGEIGFK